MPISLAKETVADAGLTLDGTGCCQHAASPPGEACADRHRRPLRVLSLSASLTRDGEVEQPEPILRTNTLRDDGSEPAWGRGVGPRPALFEAGTRSSMYQRSKQWPGPLRPNGMETVNGGWRSADQVASMTEEPGQRHAGRVIGGRARGSTASKLINNAIKHP